DEVETVLDERAKPLLAPTEGVLGPLALDHVAQLGGDMAHDLEERRLRRAWPFAEELEHSDDLAFDRHREGVDGAQAAAAGDLRPHERRADVEAGDPGRFARLEHTTGKAEAGRDPKGFCRGPEGLVPDGVGQVPDGAADEGGGAAQPRL